MQERTDAEAKADERAAHRLGAFSDGVVAIAITLLAIELPVPTGSDVDAFWASARSNMGDYSAFLLSFVVIAAAWSNHHELFRHIVRDDAPLRRFNIAWLFTIVLNPFATKLLAGAHKESLDIHALKFSFYALLQLLSSAALIAILYYIVSHELAPEIPASVVARLTRSSLSLMLGFGISIPLFFATNFAWILWFIIPMLSYISRRVRRRQ